MINRAELLKRFSDKPLLMDPSEIGFVTSLLHTADDLAATTDHALTAASDAFNGKPYRVEDGVAFIPVHGMLLHKVDSHYPGWYTGYGYVSAMVDAAVADPSVRKIVLDVASHGGEVSGCFECAAVIREAGLSKPVTAVVDGYAHSAGYALAASADTIFMSETASVGSVGVITMHVDYSKMLAEAGIKVTMIYAGEQKADGNPFEPLPKEVRARIENRVKKSYAVFVAHVAAGRQMDPEAVRKTEAGTFNGPDALEVGFVDAVKSPREALAVVKGALSGSSAIKSLKGGSTMSANAEKDKPVDQPAATGVQETAEAPAAPAVDTPAEAPKVDAAAVAKAERERIAAITGCEEAKGRASLASHLAFKTGLSVAEAKEMLAAAPQEQAAASTANKLDEAMTATGGGADVGADNGAGGDAPQASQADRIVADWNTARGVKASATRH